MRGITLDFKHNEVAFQAKTAPSLPQDAFRLTKNRNFVADFGIGINTLY